MELKTILNRVYQLPGFVYGKIRLVRAEEEGERDRLEVEVRPRANGRALCSGCGQPAPGYDPAAAPLPVRAGLGLQTFFVYAMRRVARADLKVEGRYSEALVPRLARRLSWNQVRLGPGLPRGRESGVGRTTLLSSGYQLDAG